MSGARCGLIGALALCVLQGCPRPTPTEEAPPTLSWQDTWPCQVLSDPHLAEHLAPLDAVSALWLIPPSRSTAAPWPDAWALEAALAGDASSTHLSLSRARRTSAAAWRALARLDAEALCQLGRSPSSYGAEVAQGYLFGVEGCLWAGDLEGARAAWAHWERFGDDSMQGWPAPPAALLDEDALLARELPHGGYAAGRAPERAFSTVYRSRAQEVEFAFVLPGDLIAAARDLEALAGVATPPCDTARSAALPLLVGDSPLSHAQRCGADAGDAPPAFEPGGESPISDLDGAVEAYLDRYIRAIEAEAVPAGLLPMEALPSVREMARRAVYRRVGLDAAAAGDNATALWALETAAGADWTTVARGANDPEMLCSLALARFRAGRHRPVVQTLDALGAEPGWGALADLARTVARVDAMPGADSVGVMR